MCLCAIACSDADVGTGEDLSIRELAETVREIVYPDAELVFDTSMPDGMMEKRLDVSRIHALGWTHRTSLREGIASTYQWFEANRHSARTGAVSAGARKPRARG